MLVGQLEYKEFNGRLSKEGLRVQFGPFTLNIRSNLENFRRVAYSLYEHYPLVETQEINDFDVEISGPRSVRRWVGRQACFGIDGQFPFAPYAVEHAFPAFEWGINWCVATRSHHLIMLHAAGVERDGRAILFPASPGDGKSTLCAALIHSGWRLLSDEFGLVRPEDGRLLPFPRLIPLKNESIDVILRFCPDAILGPSFAGTRKGTVAHLRPPVESIKRAQETAQARWLVFPRWSPDAETALESVSKSQAFLMVATNAFNYEVLDETAFRLVHSIVDSCEAYTLVYSDIAEAVDVLGRLGGDCGG